MLTATSHVLKVEKCALQITFCVPTTSGSVHGELVPQIKNRKNVTKPCLLNIFLIVILNICRNNFDMCNLFF